MTLGKFLSLSVAPFPPPQNGDNTMGFTGDKPRTEPWLGHGEHAGSARVTTESIKPQDHTFWRSFSGPVDFRGVGFKAPAFPEVHAECCLGVQSARGRALVFIPFPRGSMIPTCLESQFRVLLSIFSTQHVYSSSLETEIL